jgi:predicted TPR repeat methyltransferase
MSLFSKRFQKGRNFWRRLIQQYGTDAAKRTIWDMEYSQGRWNCLDAMAGDCLYVHIERHANSGGILDLGCGPGTTGSEINASAYSNYTGVDISKVAIEKARLRSSLNRRSHKNDYIVADILSFVPRQKYDVIVFGDSLYYLPFSQIPSILQRYSGYLTESGVLLVRIYDPEKRHAAIIHAIEENFDVLDRATYSCSQVSVIALRPRATAPVARRTIAQLVELFARFPDV